MWKNLLFGNLLYLLALLPLTSSATSVQTDRSWYLAGEAMTVSVVMDDALIAYAELCDTYGLAAGVAIDLHDGKGTGTVELPPDLHSGYYVLSVYTRHRPEVSQQLVAIVNPLRKSEDDDIEWCKAEEGGSRCEVRGSSYENSSGADSNFAPRTPNLTPRTSKPIDIRETEGHIIKARIKNVFGGHAFNSVQIRPSLGIIGKQIHFFEGQMVNDSTAVFYTYGIHGKQPMVLSAATTTGASLPIEMISPFATLLPNQLPHLVFHYNRSEVEARSLDMQRHQIAIAPARHELQLGEQEDAAAEDGVPLDYDDRVFGSKPDLSYNLDEYRQFHTVREVLLEYVNCVRKRRINDVLKLFVRKKEAHYDNSWPAMVLIDGMPVIDIERLLDYDARRIHYINIYGGQYTFGNGIYNGLLSFISRSGRLTNYPTEPNTQYIVYHFPE